jgi:imidazolonepropionase-like amidohydrolase
MKKLLSFCVMAAALAPFAAAQDARPVLIRNVRVFDGERTIPTSDVLIDRGRIVSVGRGLRSAAAQKVDGAGKTLVPGLIDSHVHGFPGAAADALRFGVTTEVEMFSMAGKQALGAQEQQRKSYAPVASADLWSSGVGVTPPQGVIAKSAPPGAFPTLSIEADADAFIAARAAEGSDHIKIFYDDGSWNGARAVRYERFTPEQLGRIIAAARKHKLKAVVHTGGLEESKTAIEKGAHGLAHVFRGGSDDDFIRLAKQNRAFVIPTFAAIAGASGTDDGSRIVSDARTAAFLSPPQKETLSTQPKPAGGEAVLSEAIATVRRLHSAGVTILAGTDAPNPGTAHGAAMPIELSYLVRSGLSPAEALKAATSVPARTWGMADRGRVAPGYRADLLLVGGDPTRDIEALNDIVAVWKNGVRINRAAPAADPRTRQTERGL